jgi:hypothetical protein
MSSVTAMLKANALAAVINQLTGANPIITDTGDVQRVSFSPADQVAVRSWLESQMRAAMVPGDVRVDYLPIVLPIAIKKALPFVLLVAGMGFILGRL